MRAFACRLPLAPFPHPHARPTSPAPPRPAAFQVPSDTAARPRAPARCVLMPIGLLNKIYFKKKVRARRPAT